MTKPSIQVEGLYKKFGLSLKSALRFGLKDSMRRMFFMGKNTNLRNSEFWALQDINFSIEPGDALGIMGVNGSGKTTLLRIFNGVYTPDRGKVTMRGSIGALIAAGAGFSPMLSGRENIFISGALLGMTSKEIKQKFDEIVHFADLEDFIDMPIRNYSSGMSVRLGFAVAVVGQPNILLIDEVLAVGDMTFQKKCFEKINALRQMGTTILLVSHAPGSIWAVCNKGLVIHKGVSTGICSVEEACKQYDHCNYRERQKNIERTPQIDNKTEEKKDKSTDLKPVYGGSRGGTGDVFVDSVNILDNDTIAKEIPYGKSFSIQLTITVINPITDTILRIMVDSEVNKAISIIDNYEVDQKFFDFQPGTYSILITVADPALRPGIYTLNASVGTRKMGIHLYFEHNSANFIITQPENMFFYAEPRASYQLNTHYTLVNADPS